MIIASEASRRDGFDDFFRDENNFFEDDFEPSAAALGMANKAYGKLF